MLNLQLLRWSKMDKEVQQTLDSIVEDILGIYKGMRELDERLKVLENEKNGSMS